MSSDFMLEDLPEHPVMPDSVEQIGKQLKHLEPNQIDVNNEMAGVMIRHAIGKE